MGGTAELIFTGDELLRGDIVNSNQVFLGEALLAQGLFVTHALSVTDDQDLIVAAIREALARGPEVLLLSGGLGPTEDDLTREAVSAALGRPLAFHQELMDQIEERFRQIGVHLGASNRKQALIPEGAEAIPFTGTAPGFWMLEGETLVAALPGVPRELYHMWEETLEPLLERRRGRQDPGTGVLVRKLRVSGMGESTLAEALKDLPWRHEGLSMGTRAAIDGLTLILRSAPTAEGRRLLAEAEAQARAILGVKVFGEDDEDMAAVLGGLLQEQGLTRGHRRIVHRGAGGQTADRHAGEQYLLRGRSGGLQQRGQEPPAGRRPGLLPQLRGRQRGGGGGHGPRGAAGDGRRLHHRGHRHRRAGTGARRRSRWDWSSSPRACTTTSRCASSPCSAAGTRSAPGPRTRRSTCSGGACWSVARADGRQP